jgi:hypothetical protein
MASCALAAQAETAAPTNDRRAAEAGVRFNPANADVDVADVIFVRCRFCFFPFVFCLLPFPFLTALTLCRAA